MKRRVGWPVLAVSAALALVLTGCGGGPPLTLSTFSAAGAAGGVTTFSWAASSATGDTLSCALDANGDGATDVKVADCGKTSSVAFTYPTAGSYTARLVVKDQHGHSVRGRLDVIANGTSSPIPSWAVQFGGSGNDLVSGVAVDPLGASFVSGTSNGPLGTTSNVGNTDAYLAKIDSQGSLAWVARLGTTGYDQGEGAAADGNGNGYVTGYTDSVLGKAAVGANDAFVAKFHSGGGRAWLTQFGSTADDYARAVAVDGSGNSYVTGYTLGDIAGPVGGLTDAFLVKFDAGGKQVWARQFGSTKGDWGYGVAVDGSGDVYVTGSTAGDFAGPNQGGNDVYLTKYDSDGNALWARQFGTAKGDWGEAVAVGADGTVAIAGETAGGLHGANQGSNDAFVAAYDANGTRRWLRQFGTTATEYGYGVAVDSVGNVIVTGYTNGAMSGTSAGSSDIFLAKYAHDGSQVWLRQYGTSGYDDAYGVATDGAGNVFVGADTSGYLDTFTLGSNQGPADPVVLKYGP